jgi:hypothetical protein
MLVCVCVLDRILLSPLKSLRGSATTSTIETRLIVVDTNMWLCSRLCPLR